MIHYFDQIVRRLASYPWYEVLVELAVIWICVYIALRFLRGTRGAGVVKGFAFLLVLIVLSIQVLGGWVEAFSRLNFIYDRFLSLVAILLVVVFQPELRRAMVRLGETRFFGSTRRKMAPVVEAVSESVEFLSKNQFGALIAIERRVALGALAQSGVELNANVSSRLLQSIFWPNNPLHDLGVVLQNDIILAAGVQFPLMEEGTAGHDLGSRHRAGMGLSAETDCIVVIVSEETGDISIAEGGKLLRRVPREEVAAFLMDRLRSPIEEEIEKEETAEDAEDAEADSFTEEEPNTSTTTDDSPSSEEAA